MQSRYFKVCCLSCALTGRGMSFDDICTVIKTSVLVNDWADMSDNEMSEILGALTSDNMQLVKRIAKNLRGVHGAFFAPLVHERYWQHQVVKSGNLKLDELLKHKGLIPGTTLELIEGKEFKGKSYSIIKTLIRNCQLKVTRVDTVTGLEGVPHFSAVVIHTDMEPPSYISKTSKYQGLDIVKLDVMADGHVHYSDKEELELNLETFFDNVSLVVIDKIKPIFADQNYSHSCPWIQMLRAAFNSLDKLIVVLVVDEADIESTGYDNLHDALNRNEVENFIISMNINSDNSNNWILQTQGIEPELDFYTD